MRNNSIDTLKCLCAVLVVFIHVPAPYQTTILPITRCAVPLFFMISGYFLYSEDGKLTKKLVSGMKKMLFILIWSTLLFAAVKIIFACRNNEWDIIAYSQIADFVLFNENPFGFHLWYLSAYLYVLVAIWIIQHYHLWKIAFTGIPILLLVDVTMGKYSLLLWGREFPVIWVRNWLFVGLPYFLIGVWIKKYLDNIHNIKPILTVSGGVLTILTSLLENRFLTGISMNATRDHYISTTFMSIFVFLTALLIQQRKPNLLSEIGRVDSLYIYILHPLAIIFFATLAGKYLIEGSFFAEVYAFLRPIIILLSTLVLIRLLQKFKVI